MKKEVVILIGNIGSGKSTLTSYYQRAGYVVISRDQLRYAIGGGKYIFNINYEPIIRKTELIIYEEFLKLGINIIIDEININKFMRKNYILLANDYKYKVTAMEMYILSMKESVDRRMNDPHQQLDRELWESIWKKFNNVYESPEKKEGFDLIVKY